MADDSRWRQAQAAELEFWKTCWHHPVYKDVNLEEYWREQTDLLGVEPQSLAGKSVLDLGCGPVGIINFLPVDGPRWAIDPLFHLYTQRIERPGVRFSIARGEAVPFPSESMDVVFCFNVLDHVADAEAVLADVRRLLRADGTLYVMVHTFPSWLKGLLFFDRPHTYHWDRGDVRGLLERAGFKLKRERHQRRRFRLGAADYLKPWLWPYALGQCVVTSSYYVAVR